MDKDTIILENDLKKLLKDSKDLFDTLNDHINEVRDIQHLLPTTETLDLFQDNVDLNDNDLINDDDDDDIEQFDYNELKKYYQQLNNDSHEISKFEYASKSHIELINDLHKNSEIWSKFIIPSKKEKERLSYEKNMV